MIQRIQSLFLLLVVLAFGAMFFFPMATSDRSIAGFFSDKAYDVTDHPVLLVMSGLGAFIACISIFLFRNRPLQLRLGYMMIVLAILIPVIAYLLFTNEAGPMSENIEFTDEAGMFLPLVAILFAALANYFIRKDEKLVRSMDRLR